MDTIIWFAVLPVVAWALWKAAPYHQRLIDRLNRERGTSESDWD